MTLGTVFRPVSVPLSLTSVFFFHSRGVYLWYHVCRRPSSPVVDVYLTHVSISVRIRNPFSGLCVRVWLLWVLDRTPSLSRVPECIIMTDEYKSRERSRYSRSGSNFLTFPSFQGDSHSQGTRARRSQAPKRDTKTTRKWKTTWVVTHWGSVGKHVE